MTFLLVPNESSVLMEFINGQVNIASTRNYEELMQLENDLGLEFFRAETQDTLSLTFNTCSANLAIHQKKVRQAISCALDKQAIFDYAYNGMGRLNPDNNNQDVERAMALLAETEYANGFDIRIATNLSQATIAAAQGVQAALQLININAEIQTFDSVSFDQVIEVGDFDLLISEQDMSKRDSFSDMLYSNGSKNIAGYTNDRVDELLNLERTTQDSMVRIEARQEINDILSQDVPYIQFGSRDDIICVAEPVTGNSTCGLIVIIIWKLKIIIAW
jgi:peptide/nickel transport system substrate-binding protein